MFAAAFCAEARTICTSSPREAKGEDAFEAVAGVGVEDELRGPVAVVFNRGPPRDLELESCSSEDVSSAPRVSSRVSPGSSCSLPALPGEGSEADDSPVPSVPGSSFSGVRLKSTMLDPFLVGVVGNRGGIGEGGDRGLFGTAADVRAVAAAS
jgi:hypothetical protein